MNAQYKEKLPFDPRTVFSVRTEADFDRLALATFRFQLRHNEVYKTYCNHLKIDMRAIDHYSKIPFLPISLFKSYRVVSFSGEAATVFTSSGTTGSTPSKHFVKDLSLYETSFVQSFERIYGKIEDFVVIGLLPSYLEREGSSLIYMVEHFIKKSKQDESGFFLDEYNKLMQVLKSCERKKVLLMGVSYALLDFGEKYRPELSNCIIMETGGMKGRRKEMIKSDLHAKLKLLFTQSTIHSEYGMTELLSQAYSKGLKFRCPPWMKILTRSCSDPFQLVYGKTGGINVIDLANIHSCSFLSTQDLGKVHSDHFEVIGRFDNSDIRGCNLLVQ